MYNLVSLNEGMDGWSVTDHPLINHILTPQTVFIKSGNGRQRMGIRDKGLVVRDQGSWFMKYMV